ETGSFRGHRSLASVFMDREGKIVKNHTQPRIILAQQFLSKRGKLTARWTLEIGEFFQRNLGGGITPDVRRGVASCRGTLVFGNVFNLRTLCAIEHRATSKGDQCDTNHNYKRQIAFHP